MTISGQAWGQHQIESNKKLSTNYSTVTNLVVRALVTLPLQFDH